MSEAFRKRRAKIQSALKDGERLVIPAGSAPPKNFVANVYPFRASSYFLYFAGAGLENAILVLTQSAVHLYATPPSAEDALWHGPSPSLEQLGETYACTVLPLSTFEGSDEDHLLVCRAPQIEAWIRKTYGEDPGCATALVEAVIQARLIQDEEAIRGMREAVNATVGAFARGMMGTHVGNREASVTAVMEYALKEEDLAPAYTPIVTVHGEVLHNHHYHHRMEDGDLLLVDFGAESSEGWAADVTRTWPVNGHFSSTQKAIYTVVLEALKVAGNALRPGVRYRDIHMMACTALTEGLISLGILKGEADDLVARGAHAVFFPHGVGHLLGLDVHDMEDLGDQAGYAPGRTRSTKFGTAYLRMDRDLEEGMYVTIEPGFYQVPAILDGPVGKSFANDIDHEVLARYGDVRGIRIEDDFLITADGAERLTVAIPREIPDIEQAMGSRYRH